MKFSGYIDGLLYNFDLYYVDICQNAEENSIHEMRVILKQVFALDKILHIATQEYPDFAKEDLQKLQSIFKLTGEIRDRHIIISLIPKLLPDKSYGKIVKKVRNEIADYEKKLVISDVDYNFEDIRKHLFKAFSVIDGVKETDLYKHVNAFVAKRNLLMRKGILSGKINYHKIRKYIKREYYVLHMFNKLMHTHRNVKKLSKLKKMGKKLGDWHDLMILKQYLEHSDMELSKKNKNKIDKEIRELVIKIRPEVIPVIS